MSPAEVMSVAQEENHQPPAGHTAGESAGQEEDGHGAADPGQAKAARLAVAEAPAWYPYVIGGAVALFVLAGTVGMAAELLKGPEPPDPADNLAHSNHGDDEHHAGAASNHGH